MVVAIGAASGIAGAQEASASKSQVYRTVIDGEEHTMVLGEGVCLKELKKVPYAALMLRDIEKCECDACSKSKQETPGSTTDILDLSSDYYTGFSSAQIDWSRRACDDQQESPNKCDDATCCQTKVGTNVSVTSKCIQDVQLGYDCPSELISKKNVPFVSSYLEKSRYCKCQRCKEIQATVKKAEAYQHSHTVDSSKGIVFKEGYALIGDGCYRTLIKLPAKQSAQSNATCSCKTGECCPTVTSQEDDSEAKGKIEVRVAVKAIPVLSDLPLIGACFKATKKDGCCEGGCCVDECSEGACEMKSTNVDSTTYRVHGGIVGKSKTGICITCENCGAKITSDTPLLSSVPYINRIFATTRNQANTQESGCCSEKEGCCDEGTTIRLPKLTFTDVPQTVHVPDGGTVIIGGQAFRATARPMSQQPACDDGADSCCTKAECQRTNDNPICKKCNVVMNRVATPSSTQLRTFSFAGYSCSCCQRECDKNKETCNAEGEKCCPHGCCSTGTTVRLPMLSPGQMNNVHVPDAGHHFAKAKIRVNITDKACCPATGCAIDQPCCPAAEGCCTESCCPEASKCCDEAGACCKEGSCDFTATLPPANARVMHNPYAMPQPNMPPARAPMAIHGHYVPMMSEEMIELRIENEMLKLRVEAMEQQMKMAMELAKLRAENQVLKHMMQNNKHQGQQTAARPWQPVPSLPANHHTFQPNYSPHVNYAPAMPQGAVLPPVNNVQPVRTVPARAVQAPPGCNDAKCVHGNCPSAVTAPTAYADPAAGKAPTAYADPAAAAKACTEPKSHAETRPTGEYLPTKPAATNKPSAPVEPLTPITKSETQRPQNNIKTIKVFDAGKAVTGKITVPQVFSMPMAVPQNGQKVVATPTMVQKSNIKQVMSIVRLEKQVEQLQAEIEKMKAERAAKAIDIQSVNPKADAESKEDAIQYQFYGGIR